MKFFFIPFLLAPLHIYSQAVEASDVLFLKIQELEGELASLRSELESQTYLIEKLLNEESSQEENNVTPEADIISEGNTFRFEGINDSRSIDEVYDEAISELNNKDFQSAKQSFTYLANNFNDDEKIPLSLFWLGEISLLESNLEESEKFFLRLASDFPDHWRAPLAHKKIGDIFMMSGDLGAAKIKYQFVVQTFPENTASSLALQLLENME
ncbi:tol-pal system protein [Gammaproteobacteria bacterium]|nr:tol-pal system protein [Gammaproteobacteria bacterium]MDB2677945.1 tol-pal system protein [Gammaproteobacteria bacterium]MDC3228510.1 tol-pal system protein [Gammaproteobacteria bacterium]